MFQRKKETGNNLLGVYQKEKSNIFSSYLNLIMLILKHLLLKQGCQTCPNYRKINTLLIRGTYQKTGTKSDIQYVLQMFFQDFQKISYFTQCLFLQDLDPVPIFARDLGAGS